MDTQPPLLRRPIENKSLVSRIHILQQSEFISSQSLTMINNALERTQISLSEQHKDTFHTYIACQKRKQTYRAIKYANECAQLRKLAQAMQDKQFQLHQLHERLHSATTEEERVKLRTCAVLVIQTLRDYYATTSPIIRQHMGSLMKLLDSRQLPYY